jgi:predicted transcriptional regulator of viral defense system
VKDFFGYERIDGLFIAEDEKLLIDILLKERYIGNFDEIKKAFINSTINKEKMIEYLKRINNNMLIKRIGYMLYTYKKIDISEHFILDKNYATLTLNGTLIDRKWRIKYDN